MLSTTLRWASYAFRRFRRDSAGNVILMFAGAAMCLMLIAAGAIELHRRNAAVAQLQNAADAASLAGKQRQVALRGQGMANAAAKALAEKFAKDMFDQSISKSKNFGSIKPSAAYVWNADGSLTVTSSWVYDTVFTKIMPLNFKLVSVVSSANKSTALPTEVALILDTTASMFAKDGRPDTRFTLMRNAAKSFANQLFDAAQSAGDPNLIRISVVPWATTVNIKGEAPRAANFTTFAVPNVPDKGSQIAAAAPIARAPVMTGLNFAPVQWRGCITGATEPAGAYNDGAVGSFNALQVAAGPKVEMDYYEGPLTSTPVTSCTCTSSVPSPCSGGGGGTQGFHRLIEQAVPQIRSANFLFDKSPGKTGGAPIDKAQCTTCTSTSCSTVNQMLPDCTTPSVSKKLAYCYYWGAYGRRNSYVPVSFTCTSNYGGCFEPGKSPVADKTDDACVADPNEPTVIAGTATWCPAYSLPESKSWDQLQADGTPAEIAGPNLNCPAPMLGLSGNRQQVLETLNRLTPVPGGTHADVGLRWGLRSLSPSNSWPTFFGLTKAPAAFGGGAQKVMVLITDGKNEQAVDFRGYWGCNMKDADHPDCVGSPDTAKLDSDMLQWCDVIRTTYKTTIFAIAVNFTDAVAVGKLQTCAGNPSNVFSVDAASLTSVLDGIAARVSAMRLVK